MASSSGAKGAAAGASDAELNRYRQMTPIQHALAKPGMYIGSVEPTPITTHVFDTESKRMVLRELTVSPGLLKIVDEVFSNAGDHAMRVKSASYKERREDVRPVKTISVTVDRESGRISVSNTGDSIDVAIHPTLNIWIPTMLFSSMMSSTNYDDTEERTQVGSHGLGIKLTTIFSKELIIDLVDHRAKKSFTQRFTENLKTTEKASVKASSKGPSTTVTFLPDYARFGMAGLDDDTYAMLHKRVLDMCALTDSSVSIFFNGEKVEIKDFERYTDLYLGPKDEVPRVYESPNERWEVVAAISPSHQYEQISWVNGSATILGGRHVEYVTNQIVKRLSEMATSKKKKDVKPQHIRENLMVFVKSTIVNPAFSSQTKEILTTPVAKFGSKCELSDKFFDKLYKTGIVERAASLTEFHETKKLAKTDGKKTSRVLIPKLDDANRAGTKDSAECTLILTEGDSARTMAISGLSIIGRDYYGVFPLKGKILNVKDTGTAKIGANEEIANLKKILGLEQGKTYANLSSLRYGRILVLCDQDVDGYHIKGLLFNLFQTLWPSLYKMPGFLISMMTPIVRATHAGRSEIKVFYNIPDFVRWRESLGPTMAGWRIRYLKGLGSSSEAEAKEYFRTMKMLTYEYTGQPSDNALDLAFNKARADDRKTWLLRYNRQQVLDYDQATVPYETFVDRELIHFSNRDLERSIPNICDGLKESIRKILFGCLKRRLVSDEIKVAQLAGYISEVTSYHHGEKSLQDAIVGMAQTYVGANNVNLLQPIGQFGTRIQGGKDAASPRYIHTLLSPLARALFKDADSPVLRFLEDDGTPIEPEYYIPVIPLILVNGAIGIGSGFSTNIPSFNPEDVTDLCLRVVSALDADVGNELVTADDLSRAYDSVMSVGLPEIRPWYLGFTGSIVRAASAAVPGAPAAYASTGVYAWLDDQTVEVTELPIGTWTDDYKEFLMNLVANGSPILKDFESHCTAMNIRFILKLYPGLRAGLEADFASAFKLVSQKTISLGNMHLFNPQGEIHRYTSVADIVREWSCVRISKYTERKAHQLRTMEHEHAILAAKCRFIQDIIDNRVKIMNRKQSDVHDQLRTLGYTPMPASGANAAAQEDAGFGFLTRMPIHHLTYEKKQALERDAEKLATTLAALRAKPVHHIWREELAEFTEVWATHRADIEAEYVADRKGALSARTSGAAKRRAAAAPKKK